MNVQPHHVARI